MTYIYTCVYVYTYKYVLLFMYTHVSYTYTLPDTHTKAKTRTHTPPPCFPPQALAAEMAGAFSRRLEPLGVVVRELTGDMQLSKKEVEETQMIVTTPEKWDVITRKSSDAALASLVRLLIIDEVHLLNDDRGPVIETLVARTLRLVRTGKGVL